MSTISLNQGRLCLALAAVLWSLSGPLTKFLTVVMVKDYGYVEVPALQIAFYRVFFAALVLAPTLRRPDLSWRPMLLAMGLCFALMNGLYVTAIADGTAANAVLLQYTAPMWMYLASVFLLGEPADRRSSIALAVGLFGIAVIVVGSWDGGQVTTILIALASGLTYAGVLIFLRVLRAASPRWLTVWNHAVGAVVLLPFIVGQSLLEWQQYLVLFLFGSIQMGMSYWLAARGLRVVGPQEAGAITLIEPLLNPILTYFVSGEVPATATYYGGACILGALIWRYWPTARMQDQTTTGEGKVRSERGPLPPMA